ncbi:MAG: septum formation initiator family protein [Alphaproteobacteria bacterium]|nr:septum formation initiator family protein [Alphaproteobacteria bacterium]
MGIIYELKRHIKHIVPPVIAICLLIYFVYHFFQGDRGVHRWLQLRQEIRTSKSLLEETEKNKAKLELKVLKITDENNLDLDLLEEEVRKTLNYGTKNDWVIYNHP